MSSRGYYISRINSPKPYLKENALNNIADFQGNITIYREIFSLNLISLIVGLIVIGAGIILLVSDFYTPLPKELLGIIAIIAGVIVIFLKSKSSLEMDIDIEGEAYRTKTITKTSSDTTEPDSFEELGVKSDVRLTVRGWLREEKALTGNPTENMIRDLKMLIEKITVVVEPYVTKK